MSRNYLLVAVLLIMSVFAGISFSIQSSPPGEIQKWIEQLGDTDFSTREAAQKKLWAAGSKAEDALRQAAKGDDAEIRKRAIELLEKFKWGIYPDTPIAVVDLVESYQGSPRDKKRELLEKLMDQKEHGARAIIKIMQAEEQEDSKNDALAVISSQFSRFVSSLYQKEQRPLLKKLVGGVVRNRSEGAFGHFAAYVSLARESEPGDFRVQDWIDGPVDDILKNEMLAYWHRARGNVEGAIQAARDSKNQELVFQLLMEQGKWKDVVDQGHFSEMISPAKIGYKLVLSRLVSDPIGQKNATRDLTEFAESAQKEAKVESPNQLFQSAKIALLNSELDSGLKWLVESRNRLTALEILASRFDFKQAQALLDESKSSKEFPVMEIQWGRTLYGLGKKSQALEILGRYEILLDEKAEGDWPLRLIQAWVLMKNKEMAFKISGRYLEKQDHREAAGRVLKHLFGDDGELAEPMLRYYWKKNSDIKTVDILSSLKTIIEKKTPVDEVKKITEGMLDYSKSVTVDESRALKSSVGKICVLYGLDEQLEKLANSEDNHELMFRQGELARKKKDHPKAAQAYQKAWEKFKTNSFYAFMASQSLELMGNTPASREWYEKAQWITLGDDQARSEYAYMLAKNGFVDEANKQFLFISQTGDPSSYYVGSSFRALALKSIQKKEFGSAALGYEKAMIRCMTPYVSFTQSGAYVSVPALVGRLRARDACDRGEFAKCQDWMENALTLLPGEVELPILLYSALQMKGQTKLAEMVFGKCKKTLEELLADNPGCAWGHNSAAWMSACCKKELEWGESHARKAVELDPGNAAHHDTLAEVYFQLGKSREAIASQTRAVELEPTKVYYQKQLKRIRAGNPDTEKPEESDEDD